MNFLTQTWHWSISGFLIGMVMLCLIYFGKNFGMSTNLRTLCSLTGIGKRVSFFNWDWKSQRWNLVVVAGAMVGGYVAVHFLSNATNVSINPFTILKLQKLGISEINTLKNEIYQFVSPYKIYLNNNNLFCAIWDNQIDIKSMSLFPKKDVLVEFLR